MKSKLLSEVKSIKAGGGKSYLQSILDGEVKKEEQKFPKQEPSQEVLATLWKNYLEEDDKADPFFLSYATTTVPIWKEPNIVSFHLTSNIAQGAIKKNKHRFMPYMQERLLVEHLDFHCEVEYKEEEQEVKKGDTVLERLLTIQDQNPAVKTLIESLQLDFYKNE